MPLAYPLRLTHAAIVMPSHALPGESDANVGAVTGTECEAGPAASQKSADIRQIKPGFGGPIFWRADHDLFPHAQLNGRTRFSARPLTWMTTIWKKLYAQFRKMQDRARRH